MKLKIRFRIFFLLIPAFFIACENEVEQQVPRLILVTMDGYRWQEMFTGLDTMLWHSEYTDDPELLNNFYDNDPTRRAELLNSFFIRTVEKDGILLGNREDNSFVDCTNALWFSYPGYNEILTGRADDNRIISNDKILNPNVTILEALNSLPEYTGKVAAFGSWDVFPFIINAERSGVYVNAGFDTAEFRDLTNEEILLNNIQPFVPKPWSTVRLDVFTHHYALANLKQRQPLITYIAYGETDDYAHDGKYRQYIESAHMTNQYLDELWTWVQNTPGYKDNTYLVITTDHGRGEGDFWRGHGKGTEGAGAIWIAILGPQLKKGGSLTGNFTQSQVAPTVMKLLGREWEYGDPIESIIDDQALSRKP